MTWHAAKFLFLESAILAFAALIAFAAWFAVHRGHHFVRVRSTSVVRVVVGAVIVVGSLWLFSSVLRSVLTDGRVHAADRRLHNTLRLFHSEPLHRFYSSASSLGSIWFIGPVALALAVLFWRHKRHLEAKIFVLAVAGTEIIGVALKYVVNRPRPPEAAGLVSGPSFPSGHTLGAVGLYGVLTFLLLRERPRRMWHIVAVIALVAIIVVVPLSRVYLGVHWPYDTIASLYLGIAWLAMLTMIVRFQADGTGRDIAPHRLSAREFAVTTGVVVAYAVVLAISHLEPEARPQLAPPAVAPDAVLHAFPSGLRKTSEDLIGGPMEPLSFVFVGGANDLRRSFSRAGWFEAETPSATGLAAELWAVIRNAPDPHGPATPAYYTEQPQDLTFERSGTPDGSIRHRHHIRIWRWSRCVAPQCVPLWVATCSYDMGIKFVAKPYLLTHRIDPNVDHEREFVAQTLTAAGAKPIDFITVTGPARGKNAGGDAFTTDGRAHVIDVRG